MARRRANEAFLVECGLGTLQKSDLTNKMIEKIKQEALDEFCKTRIKDFIIDDGLVGFEKARQYHTGISAFDQIDELYRQLN